MNTNDLKEKMEALKGKAKGFKLTKRNGIRILAGLAALIVCTAVVYAAATAGTESDPVVTKSYVDQKLAEAASSGSTYQIVHLDEGQTLLGGEATEMVLRAGIATAIDNGQNGVSDMTSGAELRTGDDVGLNHLLLVPRNDGRGIIVYSEAYVMVRGAYTIK